MNKKKTVKMSGVCLGKPWAVSSRMGEHAIFYFTPVASAILLDI